MARSESERGEVLLRERRDPSDPEGTRVLELRVNGVFVMDTLETSTERQLAAAALARVEEPRSVVIGGLGLGFTLHEVLADCRVERVAVVEIEDALVRWMRDGTIPHGPAFFADERLHVVVADIRMAMAEATPSAYDLVLLDVDNGPGYLVYDDNAEVYQETFLAQVVAAPCGRRHAGRLVGRPSPRSWPGRWVGVRQRARRSRTTSRSSTAEGRSREERYWIYLRADPMRERAARDDGCSLGGMTDYRTEHDSMGEVQVPADALWRAQTQRAIENFPISGTALEAEHVKAMAQVKAAAAKVNADLGVIEPAQAEAIRTAAAEIVAGEHLDHFPLDVFQTGSGTSSNMNMNEVLASLAAPCRRRGPPQRPRQRQPVEQRHLPDVDPRRRDERDDQAADPGARAPRHVAGGEGRGVRRRGEGRPDPPDGRDAGDARPGDGRLRGRRTARDRAAGGDASRGWRSCRSAAPRSAPASTPPRASRRR